jgi:hypothetical protein
LGVSHTVFVYPRTTRAATIQGDWYGLLQQEAIMGIDLQVLASHFRERRDEVVPTASIRFDRDPRLLGQLSLEARPCLVRQLPDGLKAGHYDDEGLKFYAVDRYGRPLTFTTPSDLQNLHAPDDLSPWNRAVLSFLLTLPPDTRLVLYWC